MEKEKIIWSKKDCARLIELYKENELLWNPQHMKYNDRNVRETALYEILNQMSDVLPEDATIEDIRSKITNIRSQHTRAIKCKQNNEDSRKIFWCYDLLYFLRGEPEPVSKKDHSRMDWEDSDSDLYDWSQNKIKELINLYKERDLLWNPHNKLFYSKRARIAALREIVKMLDTPEITTREIVRKFNNLRTQYGRVLKKMRKRGQKPVWWLFKDMEFLQPVLYLNLRVSLKQSQQEELQESTQITEEPEPDNDTNDYEEIEHMSETSLEIERLIREDSADDDVYDANDNDVLNSPCTPHDIAEKSVKSDFIEIDKLKGEEAHNTDEKYLRFHWLGEQLVDTLNTLRNEETIFNVVNCVNKLLTEAETHDIIEIRPSDVIKEFLKCQNKILCKDKNNYLHDDDNGENISENKNTFDVTLTFRTSQNNVETLGAISKLPNLQKVQLTGNNFDIALRKNSK